MQPSHFVDPAARPHPIEVDRAELLEVVREATSAGASLWIRIRGGSMMPAIPTDGEVRVVALAARPIRVGDVVLARAAGDQPLLHRVRSLSGDHVQLQGDNLMAADDPLPTSDVIAIADAVRADGRVAPIPAAPRALHRLIVRTFRLMWRRMANG
jgi:SOS-response transcriptional repressor LexA